MRRWSCPGADRAGPLGRGLGKLDAVLDQVGLQPGDVTAGVVFDLDRPPLSDELAELTARGAEATITYYSPDRDEVSSRTIVPRHVFVDGGRWYVLADDSRSGQRRTFRVDRIEELTPTGRHVPIEEYVTAPSGFFVDADVPRAVLRLAPAAQWIAEEYPVDSVQSLDDPAGWVEVRLPVASDRWLQPAADQARARSVVARRPSTAADEAAAAGAPGARRLRLITGPVGRTARTRRLR